MPGKDEVKYTDYRDFTGGLWERTDREAPPNALLELTDAFAQPAGGLRAFAQFKQMSHVTFPSNSIVLALKKEVGWPGPQGVLYCMSLEIDAGGTGNHTLRLQKIQDDTTTTLIETSAWTTIYSQTGVGAIDPSIRMLSYHTLTNGFAHYFNLSAQDTAGLSSGISGVYRTSTTALLTATNIVGVGRVISGTFYPPELAAHQDRLLFPVTAPGALTLSRVLFTEPRSDTAPSTANQFEPIGTDPGFVGWMTPNLPSDLIVGKDERGIVLIQGDVTQPLVREMTFSSYGMSMFPAATDKGIVYLATDDSVFLWSSGGLKDIGTQFFETPMQPDPYPATFSVVFSNNVKLGTMAYGGNWVFAGKDYVLNLETEAWHRVSTLAQAGGGKHFTVDPHNYRVYVATNELHTGTNPVLYYSPSYYPDSWDPSPSYSFTLPLIYTHGQRTNLRELHYYLVTFSRSSKLEVEITYAHPQGETPITQTLPPVILDAATNHKVRLNVGVRADWLRVKTTLSSFLLQGEAPMVERVVTGIQPSVRSEAR